MFDAKYEINKITKSCSVQVFLFREMRSFAKSLWNFAKFRQNFAPRETRRSQTTKYITSSISWLNPNIIVIEKDLSKDSFVSVDPHVYETVCYEMLVGKKYYEFQ